jgi:RND family efflux transporter MFP subunit
MTSAKTQIVAIPHAPHHAAAPHPPPRKKRRYVIGAVALVAVLGVAGAVLLMRSGGAPVAPKGAVPALTVTVGTPQRTMWPISVSASGAIAPWQEAIVGTQIGAYQLVEVRANVGDRVRRGQVLARLNPALLRAEEGQLIAAYEQAEANRKRGLELQVSGGISEQDVLQLVTEAKTSAARLAAKRLELQYTAIVAPDDGVISARTATLGAVAPAGEELFRLILRNRLEWRGELTAAQLAKVTPGQSVALELPDGSYAEAMIRQTAPALNGSSRLGLVYADIRAASPARAGMYAKGEIFVSQASALAVPAESVVIHDGRSYVVEITDTTETPKVALREVTVGRRRGEVVEIIEGLSGAERLVLQGAGFLDDGDIVRVSVQRRVR